MRVAADHRALILKTAARLFGQKRFHQVLMEDVAARAGIAKGTIYRFYRTKEELYAGICLEWLETLTRELRRVSAERATAAVRLGRMLECSARHHTQHRDFFFVVQREWTSAHMPDRAAFLAQRDKTLKVFTRVLREGQAAKEFRPLDPKSSADLLLGMQRSMILHGDPKLKPEQISKLVLEVFLNGVARR